MRSFIMAFSAFLGLSFFSETASAQVKIENENFTHYINVRTGVEDLIGYDVYGDCNVNACGSLCYNYYATWKDGKLVKEEYAPGGCTSWQNYNGTSVCYCVKGLRTTQGY